LPGIQKKWRVGEKLPGEGWWVGEALSDMRMAGDGEILGGNDEKVAKKRRDFFGIMGVYIISL
jgi:hypothetical protein